MSREVTKKEEIILIAKSFFYTKGYNKTSIQNIIDKAEIAKGTFYHYFKSKEDLLNQFISNEVSQIYNVVSNVLELDLNALDKLNTIFKSAGKWKAENIVSMKPLLQVMLCNDNLILRHTMMEYQIKYISPIYTEIINQGVNEGVFNVIDSEYISNFILSTLLNFSNQSFKYLSSPKYTEELLQNYKKLIKNFENTLERLLGLKKGAICIADDVVIEQLIKGLLEA